MIKTKRVSRTITEDVINKVTCDWCEKPFDKTTTQCNGYGELNLYFGYGSIYDDDKWIAEICDDCFEKHLKKKMRLGSK